MIYIVLSIVYIAFAIVCYIIQQRAPTGLFVGVANGICGGIGILLFPAAIFTLRCYLRNGFEADFVSWAWDAFSLYLRFSITATLILLFITITACLGTLVDKKHRTTGVYQKRLLVSLFSSVALLLSGPFYGFMTETDRIPLYALVLTIAIASAFCMRLHTFTEWLVARHLAKKA